MKCAVCGIDVDSIDGAIDDGWIPLFGTETRKEKGRFLVFFEVEEVLPLIRAGKER